MWDETIEYNGKLYGNYLPFCGDIHIWNQCNGKIVYLTLIKFNTYLKYPTCPKCGWKGYSFNTMHIKF